MGYTVGTFRYFLICRDKCQSGFPLLDGIREIGAQGFADLISKIGAHMTMYSHDYPFGIVLFRDSVYVHYTEDP